MDSRPAQNALSVKQFLLNKQILVLGHPRYSRDLALCDFYRFPKLKSALNITHFQSVGKDKTRNVQLSKNVTRDEHCFG